MAEVKTRVDWSGARAAPIVAANMVVMQSTGSEVIVTFGHAPPPPEILNMDPEQLDKYLDENPIKVLQITRISLPVDVARDLIRNLKGNLKVDE